ncbi:matrixin family metalloprotease [Stieleria varia]|uniref:Matrixin n=1 Tax=Stieleria varia TaxID=2528005 RepID=A0A5C6A058_9BACT|nr:matrixin family metalloprotease [Stieleria varia]TWT92785.1 Matrixin [Stieleria varia]
MFRSVKQRDRRIKRRRLAAQPLETRRVLAASLGWDGPGLGSVELTYYVANSPSSLSQAETNAAIQTALDAWSSAADITFTPTNQPGLRDSIDISFTNIDGVGRTLAQAYFPDDVNPARIAGDIQFDISEAWEVGNALGNRAFDLVYVAVHEIGHSLGLDHNSFSDSVLAPFVSPSQSFDTLDASDAAAIQTLYAAAESSTVTDSTVDDPVGDDTVVDETPTDDTPTDQTGTSDMDPGDTDDNPFPRNRWRRGGRWHRFGGRLDVEIVFQNYVNPTDVNGDNVTTAMDALMIINQIAKSLSDSLNSDSLNSDSLNSDSLGDVEVIGLCDSTGDGKITALDALTVINAMGNSNTASAAADETTTTDTTDTNDETDETDDTNETDDADEMIDDGGVTDDTEGDEDCHDGDHSGDYSGDHSGEHSGEQFVGLFGQFLGRRGPHRAPLLGLFGADAEAIITRFDADADGAISEDEVSMRLWEKLTTREADADGDALVSLDELQSAITAAQQEAFNSLDADDDGLLVETEVSTRRWNKISAADTDADGGVSLEELSALAATQPVQSPEIGGHPHRHAELADAVFNAIGRGLVGRFLRGRH